MRDKKQPRQIKSATEPMLGFGNREVGMKILALDLATKTGFATNFPTRESGVVKFDVKRGESPGMRYIRFVSWLREMISMVQPDLIVSEKAHHRGGAATEVAAGFATHLQSTVADIGNLETTTVHTGTVKKFATGKGNSGKPAMMAAFEKKYGRAPVDDNEADACFILGWAEEEFGLHESENRS